MPNLPSYLTRAQRIHQADATRLLPNHVQRVKEEKRVRPQKLGCEQSIWHPLTSLLNYGEDIDVEASAKFPRGTYKS
jgi:hypothetical protein